MFFSLYFEYSYYKFNANYIEIKILFNLKKVNFPIKKKQKEKMKKKKAANICQQLLVCIKFLQ